MKRERNKPRAGFTLVEIMIVVAIIGLLAAIGIPNFVRARETAQTNACINNLRVIDSAKQQWALEKGEPSTVIPADTDIEPYFGHAGTVMPAEPLHGSYTINAVNIAPTCSIAESGATNTHDAVLIF